ncbi:MAG: rod shape-determining protein MreC [Candidatus Kerfeldbacteria bacterium]|nr:rod shape-determining protein MreC [Candidatus Kerfeldbacteria bacterium]
MVDRPPQRRTSLIIGGLVAAVVSLHYLGALEPIERLVIRALSPIGRWTTAVLSPQVPADATGSASQLAARDQRIAELSVENAQLRSALDAATAATEQTRFLTAQRLIGVTGSIITRSADPTTEFVTIDRGTATGIQVDAPAIVAGGLVVGRVIEATNDTAHVLLSTDNRSSFTGVSAKSPTAQGVVSGARGLSLTMQLIPQSESIAVGDLIVTAGSDAGVPRGLILGEVDRIERQAGALFQSASLRPLYQAARLNVVTILTKTP